MKNLYIFDCFGVIVSDVTKLWMDDHFDKETQQYICANYFRKVDTGVLSHVEMLNAMAAEFGMTAEQIANEWEKHLYVKQDTLDVITKLKSNGHTVALLSNASREYLQYVFDKFDLYKYFDKMFVSAYFGCAKPDREFYRLCLDSFKEKFDKIYFTDDNPVNLVNLASMGITAVQFTSAYQFESDIFK